MDAMGTKYAQPLHQIFTGGIEVFVHILEPLGRDRFNPHQRALDIRFSHGGEKLRIFRCFHGDLGKEHHVWRQAR